MKGVFAAQHRRGGDTDHAVGPETVCSLEPPHSGLGARAEVGVLGQAGLGPELVELCLDPTYLPPAGAPGEHARRAPASGMPLLRARLLACVLVIEESGDRGVADGQLQIEHRRMPARYG
jgi:hypothetical protein